MDDEILYQGPGYTIARIHKPETMIPYGPSGARPDGTRNYGWVDLRGRPDLVSGIKEAADSTALQAVLRELAAPGSPILSSGCEHHAFDRGENDPSGFRWQSGAFVVTAFDDGRLNRSAENHIALAKEIWDNIAAPVTWRVPMQYELTIEPLKTFFGQSDCHCLMLKALGYGQSKDQANASMEAALHMLAASLREVQSKIAFQNAWHLTVSCLNPSCQQPIPIEIEPSAEGTMLVWEDLPTKLPIRCPSCGITGEYHPRQVRRGKAIPTQ